ncbi:MAG: glycoside hydrolase family 2 TIM barrel-domain containing protein, partial [Candidatus Thermochlorobacter sp.]
MKSLFLLLFTVLFTPHLSAQTYTFFENRAITPASIRAYPQSQTRQILSLVGKWKVKLPSSLESEINVPCAFSFSGRVIFEKVITLPRAFESRVLTLVSEGMGTRCEIFFNDQFVGAQTVGGVPFKIDIPSEMLRFGAENTLKIICDSRLNVPNAFPLSPQAYDKQNFAGLFRNLYLVVTSPIRFNDIDFRYQVFDTLLAAPQRTPATLPDTQTLVKLDLTVSVKEFDLRGYSLAVDSTGRKSVVAYGQLFLDTLKVSDKVTLAQFDAESNQVIRTQTSLQLLNAKLWHPTSPTRYSLRLELLSSTGDTLDDLTFSLGFRTVGLASGNFQLNRKPFLLKGLHVCEETEQTANILSPDDILRDLLLIRSAGVNALCFTELPNPIWHHFCDSLGFLTFIQLPVRNAPSRLLVQPGFLQQSELA